MKNLILTTVVLMFMIISSCASEEIIIKEQNSFRVEKTLEMKLFEESLRFWVHPKSFIM